MKVKAAIGAALLVLGWSALGVLPAWGGGWAVVVLDRLPTGLRAGEPMAIGFTVLQHGRSPLAGLDPAPTVEARHAANGEVVRVSAVDEGSPGHYVAMLTLPSTGEWNWSVRAFGDLAQTMPALAVGPAVAAIASVEPSGAPSVPSTTLLAAAAGLAVAGMLLSFRRRFVLAGAAVALAAILGAGGIATSTAAPVPAAEAAAGQAAGPAARSEQTATAEGADLFLAKGCAVCHMNQRVSESIDMTLSIGPDLSNYRNDPQFLARWLADPMAVRKTEMPNLHLAPEEIEALVSFLNGSSEDS